MKIINFLNVLNKNKITWRAHIITLFFKLILCATFLLPFTVSAEPISPKELERKALNKRFDKLKLRQQTSFVIDQSPDFLIETQDPPATGKFTIAKTLPTVKLQILPDLKPEYFPEGEQYITGWANWAHMTRTNDNRFFFPASDHSGMGCQLNLYEYSPGRNLLHKILDVDETLGWTHSSYTDGKIHGRMGVMPDGTLWAATHYGVYPDSSWWADGYRGSWLLSYNINTHEAKNWGVPLVGNMLP